MDETLQELWARFSLVPLLDDEAKLAERLAATHLLRGADAVHLAAALGFASKMGKKHVRFASGDQEQLSAARREGLRVIAL